jgi:hypothetical protein
MRRKRPERWSVAASGGRRAKRESARTTRSR